MRGDSTGFGIVNVKFCSAGAATSAISIRSSKTRTIVTAPRVDQPVDPTVHSGSVFLVTDSMAVSRRADANSDMVTFHQRIECIMRRCQAGTPHRPVEVSKQEHCFGTLDGGQLRREPPDRCIGSVCRSLVNASVTPFTDFRESRASCSPNFRRKPSRDPLRWSRRPGTMNCGTSIRSKYPYRGEITVGAAPCQRPPEPPGHPAVNSQAQPSSPCPFRCCLRQEVTAGCHFRL